MKTLEKPLKQPTPLIRKPAVFRLLVIALLAEIGYAVLNVSTMPVYLRDDRQFGTSVIGVVLVAFLLSEAVFKSPMGHLADKYGHKTLMTVGPALSVATCLLSFVVPRHGGSPVEVLAFVFLRMLDGIGAAMLWPAAFAAMGDSVDDNERQQAMSLLNLCYMLGIALALPIGGSVNDLSHTKYGSLFLAAILFAAVSLSAWKLAPKAPKVHAAGEEPSEFNIGEFLASVKKIPSYLIIAIVTFAGIGFPMPIIKLFAQDEFNMSESKFGFGVVFPGAILMAVLSVPLSKYGERIGRTRAVHIGMGLASLGLCIIASGAFVPWLRQAWVFALGGMPAGVGFLLTIPAWMASVSDIDCNKRAANLGAVMTAQGLGAIIGASFGGLLYERMGPLGLQLRLGDSFAHYAPFVACATCVVLGWLLGMKILRPDVPHSSDPF